MSIISRFSIRIGLIFNGLIGSKVLVLLLGRLVDIQLLILQVVVGIDLHASGVKNFAIRRQDVLELILIGCSVRLLNETVKIIQVAQINQLLGLKLLLQLAHEFGVWLQLQLLKSVNHHGIAHDLKLIHLIERCLMILIQGKKPRHCRLLLIIVFGTY